MHANIPFNVVENEFLIAFLYALRPMYTCPSRFVLTHTILDAESARIQIIEESALKSRNNLTMLCDGWDDAAGRSVYATVVVEVRRPPVLLGLTDMTGQRTNAGAVLEVNEKNLSSMGIDSLQIAGLCTDNPSAMIAMRRMWEQKYPRTVVSLSCSA